MLTDKKAAIANYSLKAKDSDQVIVSHVIETPALVEGQCIFVLSILFLDRAKTSSMLTVIENHAGFFDTMGLNADGGIYSEPIQVSKGVLVDEHIATFPLYFTLGDTLLA